MSTTGKVTRQGKKFSIKEASPDDPIYTRGFMIGGRYSRKSPKSNREKTLHVENVENQE